LLLELQVRKDNVARTIVASLVKDLSAKRGLKMSEEIVGMYELLDALEAVIRAADATKRKALAETVDAYAEDCPEDFFWSIGAQSPTLLSNLMMVIDSACRPESQSKPLPAIRLVDRKPEG
jgi:hypothetical protein